MCCGENASPGVNGLKLDMLVRVQGISWVSTPEQNWSETNVTPGIMHFWHGGLISSVCVLSSEAQYLLQALLKIALRPTKRLENVFE